MNIGLYFGSFNPIHIGHLVIAEWIREAANLKEVWFIVSPQNPFKEQADLAHQEDRYQMVQLAIQDNPYFKVSDVEFHMPKPSYTVDTLKLLDEKYPEKKFSLIIGGDNLASFHKWKDADYILKHFELLVYPRPYSKEGPLDTHPSVRKIEAPLLDISATAIRKNLVAGKSVQYLLPTEVLGYIKLKHLFL